MVRILWSISQDVLTLKGYSDISLFLGKPGIDVFKSVQYICQFTSLDFHIIPGGFRCIFSGFLFLPGGKFTLRSHPGELFKIWHFPR